MVALLEGTPQAVEVISDHRNLTCFTTNQLLNYRQTRWSEFLSRFDYTIVYQPGTVHGKADALTRQEQESQEENEEREYHRMQTLGSPRSWVYWRTFRPMMGLPTGNSKHC